MRGTDCGESDGVRLTGSVYSEDRKYNESEGRVHVGNLYFQQEVHGGRGVAASFRRIQSVRDRRQTGTPDYLTNFLNLKSISEDLKRLIERILNNGARGLNDPAFSFLI